MAVEKVPNKVLKSFELEGSQYHILEPNLQIVRESKYRYSRVFTDALKDGFYTKKKLESVLKEGHSDLISDHITKRAQILLEMKETSQEMVGSKDPDRLRYLAELMRIYRETLFQEDLSMKSLFDSTADNLADEERIDFLTFSLLRDDKFQPIWATFEEYMQDNRYQFVESCRYQLLCWEFKIDPNWQDTLPETEALERAQVITEELTPKVTIEEDKKKVKKSPKKVTKIKVKKVESKKTQPAEKR